MFLGRIRPDTSLSLEKCKTNGCGNESHHKHATYVVVLCRSSFEQSNLIKFIHLIRMIVAWRAGMRVRESTGSKKNRERSSKNLSLQFHISFRLP